ncbi:MAG TPA: carboxymuconolactone decarboxylase family protein [Flavisolibacter sp.]|nr:carboxymuconolactone decarboxylase family protein [Flavisolibacter sp.]
MDTFLPAIEQPKSMMMKLAYFLTRKKFGKVLTPLKVHSVRLPLAFGMFYGKISALDKKLILPREMQMMIRILTGNINVCLFCVDIVRWFAAKESVSEEKLAALSDYSNSSLFSEAERAAFDYVTELTMDKNVSTPTFKKMSLYYSEREICEIVWLVATEHVYNITNIGLNIHSDMLCNVKGAKL